LRKCTAFKFVWFYLAFSELSFGFFKKKKKEEGKNKRRSRKQLGCRT